MADSLNTLALADNIAKDNQTAKAVAKQWDRTSDIFANCHTQQKGFYSYDGAGRRYIQPIATDPIQATGRLATDTRVDAVPPNHNKAIYTAPVYNEVAVAFNFDVGFRLNEANEKAFVNAVADNIAAATEGIAAETARQLFFNDGTGTLQMSGKSMCTSTASSTGANTITFTAAGIAAYLQKDILSVGDKIDVISTGASTATGTCPLTSTAAESGTVVLARTITAINHSTGVVTFGGAATTFTNGHIVYVNRAGQRTADGSTATVREITGLPTICDESSTTSVGGLTSATVARWYGNESDASAGAISLALITTAFNKVNKRIGMSRETYAYTGAVQYAAAWQALYNSGAPLAYADTTKIEASGPERIPLPNGVLLTQERLCPDNELYVVPKDHIDIVAPSGDGVGGDGPKVSWAPVNEFGGHFRWDGNHGFVGLAFFNGDTVIDQRARFLRLHNLA